MLNGRYGKAECYSSEQITIESTDDTTNTDPAKKPKGLSKILSQCLGHSFSCPFYTSRKSETAA